MNAYELLYFVAPTAEEAARTGVMERIQTVVTESKGTIDNVDEWGKQKLAYEIDGIADADYTLVDFHSNPDSIAELDRVLRINDAVMRHMIVARTDRD